MQLTQWLLILVILIPLFFAVRGRLRVDLAAVTMAVLLGILQFAGFAMFGGGRELTVRAISGFNQPVVITLIGLFVITAGLRKSGVTRWLADQMIRAGGKTTSRMILMFTAVTALLSLFMNNLAAGALVLPSAMEASRRMGIRPSKLLIPVSYGSLLGGMATYFTTANILVSDLLAIADPPQAALHILDFTPTGGLIAVAGILFLGLFGSRLLPDRGSGSDQAAARMTGSELENIYQIGERLWQGTVQPAAIVAGHALADTAIGKAWGVTVVGVRRGTGELLAPEPQLLIRPYDRLLIVGREERVSQLRAMGVEISPSDMQGNLSAQGITLVEVILAPHSPLEGKTLKETAFRQQFDLTVIAIKRRSRSFRTEIGDIALEMGDSLLAIAKETQIARLRHNPNLIVIEANPSDQPVHLKQAAVAIGVTAAAVTASIAGVPVFLSMLAGAVVILLLKHVTFEEAYQSIEWQAIFLIAGMYAVSLSIVETGMAALMGRYLLGLITPFGALGVAGGAYLLSAILTQFIGGQVAVLVSGPVAISAAISMGISPQAAAVAAALGASSAFLTPIAHPLNVLVMAPGRYTFTDFFRAGWMLTLLCFFVMLAGMRLFWGL